ncbi:hypothetical protein [Paractinoplanes toevensis]|uniref:Uncharacterized protein n=1 Tax=Paractinoplanes toevensis TaxID=571911 RepID=A0A919WDE0_9ACTN|nr:hypothetical protein [Actinoplanes toevensis]GIM98088.1 hypothetical protein Ato02nite_098810 [Actinoplanes toevensis]
MRGGEGEAVVAGSASGGLDQAGPRAPGWDDHEPAGSACVEDQPGPDDCAWPGNPEPGDSAWAGDQPGPEDPRPASAESDGSADDQPGPA